MLTNFTMRMALVVAASLIGAASAETLYKLVDKNGKVTYSESRPKSFDGQVIELNIDPKANTATLEKPSPKANSESGPTRSRGEAKSPARMDEEARIAQARERLDRAKEALQNAKDNPAEGDMIMVGKVGGGVRHIPSEAYQQRLDRLESELKTAQEDLQRAELGR